jgi:DMSO reductase iron-sulfur subunit
MLDKTKAFVARDDEPDYARLSKKVAPVANQYGKSIELVAKGSALADTSLQINGDHGISDNPDRYKQHGFYFNADNCIACHACESACSEKNNLPAHLAFRSVGYVEGGSYPDYHRLNISMACNHCDDPVCLKGCPTRAYTKFAEYGAVLQDPDICFGCGYCTWVCPYNAPQLDPVNGQVEKCNMCVDRLEAGLKPACVSACLAGALDFGVIDTRPEKREQLKTNIPGFPTPDITHPNIRFQQTRSLPPEMGRPDDMPLQYQRAEQAGGLYTPQVRKTKLPRGWGLDKLSSRENPLVLFSLMSQAAVGGFLLLFLAPFFGIDSLSVTAHPLSYCASLIVVLGLQGLALLIATVHLGKPLRFYRGFNNLRYSPVSREAAALMVFYGLLAVYSLLTIVSVWFSWSDTVLTVAQQTTAWGAVIAGPLALYFMYRIYRIPARPFWDHWQVLTSFYGNMLTLASVVVGSIFVSVLIAEDQSIAPLIRVLAWPLMLGLILEAIGLFFHRKDLVGSGGEGAASMYLQQTRFGKTYRLRNIGLGMAILLVSGLAVTGLDSWPGFLVWGLAMSLITAVALVGRALFYVLVIPTTMPGAFFWRNKGFEQHAQKTGLVNRVAAGVLPDAH